MSGDCKESDWKYLRKIKDDLLKQLCERINRRSLEILTAPQSTPHEKYLALYRHVEESDAIIAICFNDWRRSTLKAHVAALYENDLLTKEHCSHFSDDLMILIKVLSEYGKDEPQA